MERPTITRELIAATAARFCLSNGWDADQAEDLIRVYQGGYMDGYEWARELESVCGWNPTVHDVQTLDHLAREVREAYRKVCIAWARENNIQPPLPIGTMTTQGEITGICEHDAACYKIRRPGDPEPTLRYIVPFEDVREATPMAADAAA
jgi:hypothetical protein